MDLATATALQGVVHAAARQTGIPLRDALMALYGAFLDSPFTIQSGLLLLQIDRDLALDRLEAVARDCRAAA